MKINYSRGFTLIEILIVLAIIGLLISLAIIGLQGAQSNQRDAARKDIASQINVSLQAWYEINNSFPAVSGASSFYGSSSTNFIQQASCNNNGYMVNNTCVAFDNLVLDNTSVQQTATTCTTPSPFDKQHLYLCYVNTGTNQSYNLYTYLDNKTLYQIH